MTLSRVVQELSPHVILTHLASKCIIDSPDISLLDVSTSETGPSVAIKHRIESKRFFSLAPHTEHEMSAIFGTAIENREYE